MVDGRLEATTGANFISLWFNRKQSPWRGNWREWRNYLYNLERVFDTLRLAKSLVARMSGGKVFVVPSDYEMRIESGEAVLGLFWRKQ